MPSVVFNYKGNSKELPLNKIKSEQHIADIYSDLGLKSIKSKKRRLGYTLPNGKTHTFLSTKNHKYAVCCTNESTGLACDYTHDYEKAKNKAAKLNFKTNNAEWGFKKWTVIEIKEVA